MTQLEHAQKCNAKLENWLMQPSNSFLRHIYEKENAAYQQRFNESWKIFKQQERYERI